MKLAATQELFSYWNRLRAGRLSPERSDIDPAAIRGILADTFILDISENFQMPLRIAGARISALFTRELKGHDFLNLWRPDFRTPTLQLITHVAGETAPALAGIKAVAPGRPALDMELLVLPLRHFGKPQARVLGCLTPAISPAWLGLTSVSGLELGSMRILRDETSGPAIFGGPNREPFTRPVRHGHLRLHDGGAPA